MGFVLELSKDEIIALAKLLKTSIEMDKFMEGANPATYRKMKETSSRAKWESALEEIMKWMRGWGYNADLSKMF